MKRLPSVRPLFCIVTDRRRLSPGAADDEASAALVRQVEAAAATGAAMLVQVREPDLSDAALGRLVARCVDAAGKSKCVVLVNDRLDVALGCGADGVHLRRDSIAAERVREIAPHGFVIGRSVHSVSEVSDAARSGILDYLIFGTVFRTESKPSNGPVAGLALLSEAVAAAASLPVLAIGGIGPEQARHVAKIGAAGVAGIGFFLVTEGVAMAERVATLQQSFDSSTVFP